MSSIGAEQVSALLQALATGDAAQLAGALDGAEWLDADARVSIRAVATARDEDRRWRGLAQTFLRTAVELSRSRERETVLREIVAQARELVAADLAYISLNDGERDGAGDLTRIHTTDGVLTDAYRSIRMPLGSGLLGRVAASDQPAQTADYFADASLQRIADVDEAVRAEGVRAILGAPIRIDGAVSGALLVADRRPRVYDAVEVATIAGLASLAAVVLETAQLFGDLGETVEALSRTEAENRRHIAELERLAAADAALLDDLVHGRGTDSLREVLSEQFGSPVEIAAVDRRTGVLTRDADDLLDAGYLHELAARSAAFGDVIVDDAAGTVTSVMSAKVGARWVGAIAVRRPLDDIERRILRRSAASLAARLIAEQAVEDAHLRERSELVRAVVTGRSTRHDHAQLARLAGVQLDERDPADAWIVVVEAPRAERAAAMASRIFGASGIATVVGGHAAAIVSSTAIREDAERWLDLLRDEGVSAVAGCAPLRGAGSRAADAHDRARRLASALTRLGRTGEVATESSLGSVGLLLGASATAEVERVVDAVLGPAIRYDRAHGTELVRTAHAHVEADRSVARTAAALTVHENTVRQRLEKLEQLLGRGWSSGTRALDAHLALRFWALGGHPDEVGR